MPTDLRNLPDLVLARIGDVAEATVVQRGVQVEGRPFHRAEIRDDGDGSPALEGYATVYDVAYDVMGGPPFGWTETIAAGAARKSVAERDDVKLLVNHAGIPLARTKSGTMTLSSDDVGLRVEATLDGQSPEVQALRSAMERGDMDEMSFAFTATRQEWNEDYTERRITEVKLYDVSVVTEPANPATHAQLRGDQPPEISAPPAGLPLRLAKAQAEILALRGRTR